MSMKESIKTDRQTTGVHPVAVEIGIGCALWFLLVVWFAFARGPEVDYLLVVVSGFFVIFFGLILLTASYAAADPRWRQSKAGFFQFLHDDVPIDGGRVRGRKVLIEICLIPVSLALAATLIGLAWVIVH